MIALCQSSGTKPTHITSLKIDANGCDRQCISFEKQCWKVVRSWWQIRFENWRMSHWESLSAAYKELISLNIWLTVMIRAHWSLSVRARHVLIYRQDARSVISWYLNLLSGQNQHFAPWRKNWIGSKNVSHLSGWARRALPPCKVWGRSNNVRRLKVQKAQTVRKLFPSVPWHCWLGDRKGIRPVKSWMLVCWWWWFYRSFVWLITPVVTTTSIILSFN